MKHHPYFRNLLTNTSTSKGSFTPERLAYGARVLTEGGLQSVPLLHFPGGALIGCSAGFVNIAKIKGVHNAMKTGMLGAEGAFEAIHPSGMLFPFELHFQKHMLFQLTSIFLVTEESSAPPVEEGHAADLSGYTKAFTKSWVYDDLNEVRNLRPSFATKLGLWGGIAYSGMDSLFLRGKGWWTFRHTSENDRKKYIVSLS